MCGIVGAAARRDIVPTLVEGLRRLEYRGYDSCGVAMLRDGAIGLVRTVSRVSDLAARVKNQAALTGIAHTRWATHGAPATENAHPILSRGEIAVVHNGIIENHEELRAALQKQGYKFESQTDTEVIAHLVHSLYRGSLLDAVHAAVKELKGAYAIAVVSRSEPHTVVGARAGSPLVVGRGKDEFFLASDALALAGATDQVAYLDEGDVVSISQGDWKVLDRDGRPVEREVRTVKTSGAEAELGPYRHFMQKEIFEQPRAVSDTLLSVASITPELFGAKGAAPALQDASSVLILACGTSWHAGLVARYWLESIAGIRCNVEIASEYRYRSSVPDPKSLVVTISQSGETADTLSALKHAQSLGQANTLAVCNVATSAMMRMTALQFLTHAGAEIGVASTKAFTTQLTGLFLLALTLAKLRGRLKPEDEENHLKALRHLPTALSAVLALEPQVIAWAERFAKREHALFLGRGVHYPIALEGALKLKEISYIHAEAYPAGELKHGPLSPILHVVPLQLLAYHTAVVRGTDVDKPRNLAKSVTVE